jgi:7-keto-8-aminopelargonate synthetase-like enzyme
MDGDLAPLPALAELAERHGALLVVDDAHATGVIGGGRGSAHHFNVAYGVHVHMGTFGKALGSFGAFAAASGDIVDLLVNRARSLIYTTAPPPSAAGAVLAALHILEAEPQRVTRLAENARTLREGLQKIGFDIPDDPTPIIPLILGGNRRTLDWSRELWARGFWVHPIRPPTVPENTSRLRITVTAGHTREDIQTLCAAIADLSRHEATDNV